MKSIWIIEENIRGVDSVANIGIIKRDQSVC